MRGCPASVPPRLLKLEKDMVQIQKSMVAIALRGVTVLPSMSVYLDMERNMSIAAAKTAQKQNAEIFLVAQKNARQESPAREDLERFGVIAAVRQIMTLPNNKVRVLVNGLEAAELVDITGYVPQLEAVVRTLPETEQTPERREAMCRILREETGRYLAARAGANRELKNLVELEYEFGRFLRQLSCNLPMSQPERQEYLGLCTDDEAAYDFLIRWLVKETDVEAFRKDYQNKVRHNLDQHQKEYILREQMKVIRDELGDGAGSDADRFEEQLKQLEAPEEVLQELAANGQIATQYVDFEGNPTGDIMFNPNGSMYAIEGMTSPDGRVFGKMGHAERIGDGLYKNVPGRYDMQMFASAVEYFK